VLKRGCWSEKESFGASEGVNWSLVEHPGGSSFDVLFNNELQGTVHWDLTGHHNRTNALAAIAAARHVGVPPSQAVESLARFQSVKRRMEVRGVVNGVTVYDDFAHHPTAIATTVAGLRQKIGAGANGGGRILAVLEPRSNTMKLGAMKDALPGSLKDADLVFGFGSQQALGWSLADALKPLGAIAHSFDQLDYMVQAIVQAAQPGDHILVMSNGGFGGVHQKLLDALAP
jgi:UDP-N-acetylmuramate: L-alanyl-gamma-D-glutamyl-meso-diaminopimelate ligase